MSFVFLNRTQWLEDNPVHLYRAPSVDMLPKVGAGAPGSGKELRRQRSYARDLARDVKNFHSKQGLYEFYPKALQDEHGKFMSIADDRLRVYTA